MTRTHKVIFSSIVCAALLASCNLHAAEIKRPQFFPKSTWSVHALKTVSDYGGECVIETEFNNGFILQLNGSSNWVQQLNLNIRQGAFRSGQDYTVKLGVPGSVSNTIASNSPRENIISVPIKGNKNLYKSMRENAVLDFDVEDNRFRFFLTGFSQAAKKFETCMSGGAPGRVAATNPRSDDATLGLVNNANAAPEFGVSTRSMSDAEKDFMVNEAIAYEKQEARIINEPVIEEVITEPAPAAPASSGTVSNANEQGVFLPEPPSMRDDQSSLQVDDDYMDAPRHNRRAVKEYSTHQRLSEQLAEEMQGVYIEEPAPEPIIGRNFDNRPLPVPESRNEPIEMPNTAGNLDVSLIEEEAEPMQGRFVPEPAAKDPTPIMPASDIAAAQAIEQKPFIRVEQEPQYIPPAPVSTPATITPQPQANRVRVSERVIQPTTSTVTFNNQNAASRIDTLEEELRALRAENRALNDELEVTLKEAQEEQVSVSSDNWNLERATMRYNEAERQLQKLGQQLQQERAQHAMERKELEAMLFDPQLTEQEQLARLNQLEQELEAARMQIRQFGGSL